MLETVLYLWNTYLINDMQQSSNMSLSIFMLNESSIYLYILLLIIYFTYSLKIQYHCSGISIILHILYLVALRE